MNDMPELRFTRELTQIDRIARENGGRVDWSMAMEPNSLSFFDGILSGISGGRSYYLKEDLIYEMLARLRNRDARFAKYFLSSAVYHSLGYPLRPPY